MNYTYKCEGRDLDMQEYSRICNFLLLLNQNRMRNYLIYRGDSIENIRKKLNITPSEDFYTKLEYFIFSIGEKGKIYQREYREKTKKENCYSIEDISPSFFEYIFKKFNHVFSTSRNDEILQFMANNKNFADFFLEKENCNTFISAILKNDKAKALKIRDYYLKVLHRMGKIGFSINSFFVSTTTDEKIAKRFSSDQDIIYVGWTSCPVPNTEMIIKNAHIPLAKTRPYNLQFEVSMKGGIFPHYLLGYINRRNNEFIINPHFFSTNVPIDDILKYGMSINQNDFHKKLNLSGYTDYIYLDEDNEYKDSI